MFTLQTQHVGNVNINLLMTAKKKARSGRSAGAYHHGDLRKILVESAEAMLEEGGVESLSLREAARRAGVSHAAPYRHFSARVDLLYAIAERGFSELAAEMQRSAASSPDPAEQLHESGFAYVRLAIQHPERLKLMFGSGAVAAAAPEATLAAGRSAFQGLENIILAGQERGVFRDGPPNALAMAAWSLVHGAALLITGGQCPPQAIDSEAGLRAFVRPLTACLIEGLRGPSAAVPAAIQK